MSADGVIAVAPDVGSAPSAPAVGAVPSPRAPVLVKTTLDGRQVEVIGRHLCLGGVPEADALTVLDEHPNRQAILRAVPLATHVAGRVPLTMAEASVAQAALRRAQDRFDGSAAAVQARLRQAVWQKSIADGADA
jgi:hypothetical protein